MVPGMVRRRTQARPRGTESPGRRRVGPIIGWAVAVTALVALAVVVGRPSTESGVEAARSTPTPDATLSIAFGTGLQPGTNLASPAESRFRSGDPFAYSVTLDHPPGTDSILVQVLRLESPEPVEVQAPSDEKILPDPLTFGFQVPADRLLTAWGAGDYEMRIYVDGETAPTAIGQFTLLATP